MGKRAQMSGHGHAGHNSGSIWLSRAYNVVDRDSEIDRFQKLWQKEKLEKESELAMLAGLSPGTVSKMFGGVTRQPRHSTFGKMAGALGYHYDLVRDGDAPDYAKEIQKARAEFKMYRSTLAKRKARKR